MLDGVNAAPLGLMAAVPVMLTRAALVDGLSIGLTGLYLGLAAFTKINSTRIILDAALIGLLRFTVAALP